MDLGLKGKGAIVVAASKGIGKAVALRLAEEGAKVAICARNEKDLRKAADEIREGSGSEVFSLRADVTRPEEIRTLVQQAAGAFGRIDILVNNAGGPPLGTFEDVNDEQWQGAFQLTFLSVIRLIREVLPHMKKAGGGRVINIASTSVKQPIDNLILSNSIRLGVVGLAKTLSLELARHNITVNTVCPGGILTERFRYLTAARADRQGKSVEELLDQAGKEIPLGRLGRPEELADTIAFLASERASYITGVTIQVDGGLVKGIY